MATEWASRVSGPIASHHIYERGDEVFPHGKVGKVKNERKILNVEGKGYIGSFSNRTVSPKDHMRENVKRMREIQRASRQRQEESKQQRGPIKTTSRPSSCVSTPGGHVEQRNADYLSRVHNQSPETLRTSINNGDRRGRSSSVRGINKLYISPSEISGQSISNRDYLRAHEKTGPLLDLSIHPLTPVRREVNEARISVPRASTAREVQLIRRDVDFVRANAYSAKSARMRRSPSADSLLISQNNEEEKRKQYKRGETPSYLLRRRKQWQDEEEFALANQPDPDQPQGHRKLPEKERKAMLEELKANEKDMLTELGRLPIRTDTLKLRTMKQEIEHKLNEIEEAIKIFSKPKVFVRIDT